MGALKQKVYLQLLEHLAYLKVEKSLEISISSNSKRSAFWAPPIFHEKCSLPLHNALPSSSQGNWLHWTVQTGKEEKHDNNNNNNNNSHYWVFCESLPTYRLKNLHTVHGKCLHWTETIATKIGKLLFLHFRNNNTKD